MRVGIYGRTAHPVAAALAQGFGVHGHAVSHREQGLYRDEVEPFGLVLVNGMRGGRRIVARYERAGIPVLVYDFGYLRRVNAPDEYERGYWQVGLGGLNRLPPFECPPDRLGALEIEIAEHGGNPIGYVLVCGQVPGDAAHGLGAEQMKAWLAEQLEHYPGAVYRPHPRGGIDLPGVEGDRRPLAEALAGARLVVTNNSNIGHDALLAGVPVVCGPGAAYEALAGESLPSVADRRDYFARVAYGQWHPDEMASGEAQAFWLNHLLVGAGPAIESTRPDGAEPGEQIADADPAIQPADAAELPVDDGLGDLDAEQLHVLAKERGVKVHARSGAEKVRAALREAA